MSKELVVIDAQEFGIEEKKAQQISDMFKPMLDKMVELEKELNEVITLPINPDTCSKARELRLKYKNTRTGTATIHKELKAFYLNGGRFVDGWKNAQAMASQGAEEKLKAIENYYEIQEQERITKLQEKRSKILTKLKVEVIPENLGEMDDTTWNNYHTGTKVNLQRLKDAEAKAEKERVEKEKRDTLRSTRQLEVAVYSNFIPDFTTQDWGEKTEKEYKTILDKAMADYQKDLEEKERIRKENEELLEKAKIKEAEEKKEREAREKKEKELREAREKVLAEERIGREKAEALLKKQADEKVRLKQAEEDRIEAELAKGDKEKVKDLIADLQTLTSKYTFDSAVNKKMYESVGILLGKTIAYIENYGSGQG